MLAIGAVFVGLGVGFGVGCAALGTLAVQHVPMDSSGINSLVRTAGGWRYGSRQHRVAEP